MNRIFINNLPYFYYDREVDDTFPLTYPTAHTTTARRMKAIIGANKIFSCDGLEFSKDNMKVYIRDDYHFTI